MNTPKKKICNMCVVLFLMMLGFSTPALAQVPSGYTIVRTHNDDVTWYEVKDDQGNLGAAYNNTIIDVPAVILGWWKSISYSHGYFIHEYRDDLERIYSYCVYDKNGKKVNIDGENTLWSSQIRGFEVVNGELYMSKFSGIYDSHCKKIAIEGNELIRSGNSVYIKNTEKWKCGIYDLKKEKQVLDPKYGRDDLVIIGDLCKIKENGECCIYDLKNEKLIPMPSSYDKIIWIYEVRIDGKGTQEFRLKVKKDGKYGICDIKGLEIIAPNYYDGVSCCDIEDDHFYIVEKDGKEGVCDKNGQEIMVPNLFDNVTVAGKKNDFYYIVEKDRTEKRHGKEGVYDMYGIEVIAPKYESVYLRKTGDYYCFEVNSNNKEGVCDMHGHEIIQPKYDDVRMRKTESGHYYYEIKQGRKEGVSNIDGHEVIAPKKYTDIILMVATDGRYYYKVERKGKEGICDMNGQEIIAPKYDNVSLCQIDAHRCYFEIERKGEKGACDMNGKTIVKLIKCESLFYSKYTDNVFTYKDASGKYISTGISLDMNGDPYVNACSAYNKYCDEGDAHFKKKNYKKAADSFKKALEYKQTAEAYYDVAASYYNMGKYDDAITYFQYCLYSAPEENLKKDAQNRIELSRQFIAQKEARREEVVATIIGGAYAFTAGVLAGSMGINNTATSGNMDYLLDPNLAIAQAQQQQAEMNAVNQQLINLSIQQAEQQEYDTYLLMTSGGTSMTFEEWKGLMAQAAMYESNNMEVFPLSDDGSSEYKGKLSPDQYEAAYRRYENCAQSCFRALTAGGVRSQDNNGNIQGKTVGQMPGGSYVSFKQGLSDAQREMKRIRQEAAQYGVIIQQSQWEKATAGY